MLTQRCHFQRETLENKSRKPCIGDADNAVSAPDLREIKPIQSQIKLKGRNNLCRRNIRELQWARRVQQRGKHVFRGGQRQQLHRIFAQNLSKELLEFFRVKTRQLRQQPVIPGNFKQGSTFNISGLSQQGVNQPLGFGLLARGYPKRRSACFIAQGAPQRVLQ